ncbi:hypothetical protein JL722_6873 [Aureococcus anophagefferens]|nr:hypothetical protein JL722_6873 [Aureococcus anophagefferens]
MASQVDAVEREFLLCARYGELEEMLEELAKGADVMARGDGGNTALHMACANGHEAIVAALLDRGAEPSATNDCGNTPAHYAAQQRHAPCLRLIVARARTFTTKRVRAVGAHGRHRVGRRRRGDHRAGARLGDGGEDHRGPGGDGFGPRGALSKLRGAAVRVRELQISKAVDETLGDGGGASDRTGLGIWAASLALGRWLAEKGDAFDRARVVELGGGCGVGGLALAAACPTARVVVTDCFAETLENAAHNVALFREDRPDEQTLEPWFGSTARVASAKLDWDAEPGETCDFVVGADLVYHEAVVDKLTLGFEHVARDAPPAYGANALADGDDDKFLLYFPDVATATFALHRFVRPFK